MPSNEIVYGGFRRGRGDATFPQGVLTLLVPTDIRALHIASAGDAETDWNLANPTDPAVYLHSETTPATDYLRMDHDGTTADIDVVGGTTLSLQIDSVAVVTMASTGLTFLDDNLVGIGTGNAARFSWDTTDANANELLLQLPAGGAVDVPVLAIGQSIESVDLALFNGVVDPTIAIFGIGAVATGPRVRIYKARGTIAAPTVVTSGDDLFSIDAYGAVAAGEYVQAARILFEMTGTIATTRGPGGITLQTATDAAPSVLTTALTISAAQLVTVAAGLTVTTGAVTVTAGAITSASATAGIGYATGAGGIVTQATNKSTGVTLNTVTGAITMNGAALAGDTTVSFVLTDSAIAATDAVIVLHESVGTLGAYSFASTAAAGSVTIGVHNNTAGSLSEAIVLRFVVIKSVNA